jgi:enoyl-CoA hydratase
MTEALVRYEAAGNVAWVALDDGKANALSPQLITELDRALDRAEAEAKAVVLTGRAGRFCAGYDLAVMMSGKDAASDLVTAGAKTMARLYCLSLPVVVACSGHAMAGGALLLLCGDRRIGIDGGFKIGLNEVSIGIPLPAFGLDLARERLDPRLVTAATVCSEIFTPAGAVTAGFLDELVAEAALQSRAQEVAEELASLSRSAYTKTKRGLRQATANRMVAEVRGNLAALLG